MAEPILPLSNIQAKSLAGRRWLLFGETLYFKDYDHAAPGQPPWRSGAEGKAFPLVDSQGRTTAYLKFFTTPSAVRYERTLWLVRQQIHSWVEELCAAPSAWVDSRQAGRPDGVDFDLTGCFAAAAPGETWLELKYRLSEGQAQFDRERRRQCVAELVLALATLEQGGIIHGDLSPQNILIDFRSMPPHPLLSLIDFDAFVAQAAAVKIVQVDAIHLIDFDAFVAQAAGTPTGMSLEQGGTYGTEGYCPPDLVEAAEAGDLTVAPYSDRHSRDMLILELLLAGRDFSPELPPSKWDRDRLRRRLSALLATLPEPFRAAVKHLDPEAIFAMTEGRRPASTDLAKALGCPLPGRRVHPVPVPAPPAPRRPRLAPQPRPAPSPARPGPPAAQPTRVAFASPAPAVPATAPSSRAPWGIVAAGAAVAGILLIVILSAIGGRVKVKVPKTFIAGAAPAVDLGGGVKLDLVRIPAGSFSMGSGRGNKDEGPVHPVTFAKAFYLGKYEVTQEQWQAIMGDHPSSFKGPKNPVEQVSWDRCKEFLGKLRDRTGHAFALPTEAEWEYACRAGSTTDFCFGDAESGLGEYAWYSSNSGQTSHPVGEKRPNAWGLYDMHGNVWEWCEDFFHNGYQGAPEDGSAWLQGGEQGLRVLRGGSWGCDPTVCRSARRFRLDPAYEDDGFGCRVVLRDF